MATRVVGVGMQSLIVKPAHIFRCDALNLHGHELVDREIADTGGFHGIDVRSGLSRGSGRGSGLRGGRRGCGTARRSGAGRKASARLRARRLCLSRTCGENADSTGMHRAWVGDAKQSIAGNQRRGQADHAAGDSDPAHSGAHESSARVHGKCAPRADHG